MTTLSTNSLLGQNYSGKNGTMWKFQDFCVIFILREINFGEARSCKRAFFANLWALIFVD